MLGRALSLLASLPCSFGLPLVLYALRYAAAPVEPLATSMANVLCLGVNSLVTPLPRIWETGTESRLSLNWALVSLLGVLGSFMSAIVGEQRMNCNASRLTSPATRSAGQPAPPDQRTPWTTSRHRQDEPGQPAAGPRVTRYPLVFPLTAAEPHRFAHLENQSKPETP